MKNFNINEENNNNEVLCNKTERNMRVDHNGTLKTVVIALTVFIFAFLVLFTDTLDTDAEANKYGQQLIEQSETSTTVSTFNKIMKTRTITSTTTTVMATTTTTSDVVSETTVEIEEVDEVIVDEVIVEEEDVYEYISDAEYIVFKPSTHYVHRSTCKWVDNTCYEITSTDDIESRICGDCNPDIEVVTPYEEPQPVYVSSTSSDGVPIGSDGLPHTSLNYVTEEERIYLCNTVAQEYGCDWISQYDKALVVAVVMNRLADGGWQGSGRENTIYNILTAPNQFNPDYAVPYYRYNVTDSCITAVDYYFENMDSFPHYTSFYGDGSLNYFS